MPDQLDVTQIALGRFHHFHLARQMERHGRLREIWTGYPLSRLRDEQGIAREKIHSFPWLYVPTQLLPRVPVLGRSQRVLREMHWQAVQAIDRHVAKRIDTPTVLVGLSSGGLHSGKRARAVGGHYVCDRGSTHIRFQDSILHEEYRLWGQTFEGVDPRVAEKEEAEYEAADRITVPSTFCVQTFIDRGVPADKIRLIPYGGRLDRFSPQGQPDPETFRVLFVGGVSIRKGVPYLLQAFEKFSHPRKRLTIIGSIPYEMTELLRKLPTENVEILGAVPNTDLARHYSTSDVMVLPSLEEGLSMVMAEAMACGCPVIAAENTGARDLFDPALEGRIVPVRSVEAITDALETLASDRKEARALGKRARKRIQSLGGYDDYGAKWEALIREFENG